ncbi:unnamed protein product [Caenorhabditis brenneri]
MSSTSVNKSIDECIAIFAAEIRMEEEKERQKMMEKELELEKKRREELENAQRLADDEARAIEALTPPLPWIGSRYPMVHSLSLSFWFASEPAAVASTSHFPAPAARPRATIVGASPGSPIDTVAASRSTASNFLPRGFPASISTFSTFRSQAPPSLALGSPAPGSLLPSSTVGSSVSGSSTPGSKASPTPVSSSTSSGSAASGATARATPAASVTRTTRSSKQKRLRKVYKQLEIDMVPAKRARKVINYYKK